MLRNAFKNFTNFLRLLRGMPPTSSGVSNAGAKQASGAMNIRGIGGFTKTGADRSDNLLGKALADGHKVTVYGDPASKRRVVGYGGRTPEHRKKTSGFVTVLLVGVFIGALLL